MSQYSVNVSDISLSLQDAASKVKQLSGLSGVEELKEQLSVIQGEIASQGKEIVDSVQKVCESIDRLNVKHESTNATIFSSIQTTKSQIMAAINAETHRQIAMKARARADPFNERSMPMIEKRIITTIAAMYGWQKGAKQNKRGAMNILETDDELVERRWKDALETLEVVTIPGLSFGSASYDKFINSKS